MGRIVERIALRIGVGTGLQPAGRVGQLKLAVPPLVSSQIEGEMREARVERDDGIRYAVVIVAASSDPVPRVALQSDVIGSRRGGRGGIGRPGGVVAAARDHGGAEQRRER